MSDFTSDFWGIYIGVITVVSIIACAVLLYSCSTRPAAPGTQGTTGHTWDDDLAEWNSPLPRWWMWLFYITIVFGLIYLVLYPGLGRYPGVLGWTSTQEHADEQAAARKRYGPLFDGYLQRDVAAVAADPAAREIGQRLFLNYCSQCHGSDAGGSRGFPSLRDRDWLYGGDAAAIKTSIADGRHGVMPPLGAALGGDQDVKDVAHHVLKLAGRTHDELRASRGAPKFNTVCVACHAAGGKGNVALGAPNLTDGVWLHGGNESAIIETITKGRSSQMPAHKEFLDEGKIHLLSAYVYGLSAPAAK